MKRAVLITLIGLIMIGLFAVNQTLLLAKSAPEGVGPSRAAAETMATASRLYETGQYLQAVQAYQQLVDQGLAGSALFYNLGNAYYQRGDYGRAIANYRRAQDFSPRDADIKANLALARAKAEDPIESAKERNLPEAVGQAVKGWLSLNEAAMAALGAWILFVLLVLVTSSLRAGTRWRRTLQAGLAVAAVALVVAVVALGAYLYTDRTQADGVIVASEVDVTSGPGMQYETLFTLHDGAEVKVIETRGSWMRLALPGGDPEGWVPAHSIVSLTR